MIRCVLSLLILCVVHCWGVREFVSAVFAAVVRLMLFGYVVRSWLGWWTVVFVMVCGVVWCSL